MIIFWFTAKSLAEYLKLKDEGKLGKPERPKNCNCGKSNCFWVHGFYERWVEAYAESKKIEIHRFKCSFCGGAVSVLPCFVVPQCRYAMEVIAGGIEGYATTETSYRKEVTKLGMKPSPSQLFRWVACLLNKTEELILDVQARCISDSIPEEELEKAEIAKCPNSYEAQLPGKDQQLHGLAKLVAFGKVLFKVDASVTVLRELGMFFLKDVQEMQQIFKREVVNKKTPQRMKP